VRVTVHGWAYQIGLLSASAVLAIAAIAYGGSGPFNGPEGPALWVVNNDNNAVAEFAGSTLKASGETAPSRELVSADLDEPWGLIFDSHKNLWVSNVDNGTVTEFTLGQLKQLKSNDAPAAAVVIGGLHRPEGLAFDRSHNLWVANEGNNTLAEFTPSQLASSGSPTPKVTISSADFEEPVGIAFNGLGDLWVANDSGGQLTMFTKSQLAAGGTQAATVVISSDGSSLSNCEPLILDKSGDLWVGNNGGSSVVEFTPSQFLISGDPTPAVTLTATAVDSAESLDVPTGLAFDKSGNLWVGNQESDHQGSVAKFSKKSIKSNGSPTPAVFIDSNSGGTNLNNVFFLAFGPKVP
jgi:sugar lactone lactonase YvrE